MRFLKRYKAYILACICIIAALCFAFFMGDDAPAPKVNPETEVTDATAEKPIAEGKTEKRAEAPPAPPPAEVQEEAAAQENAEKVQAEATMEEKTEEAEEENALQCTLSVRCDTALGKAGEKNSILPQDGVIFAGEGLAFSEGESVFDVLLREMQTHGIPLEFTKSPMYQSVYIEGIGNLYERDCGNQSGWIYKVNGEKPGCDCSNYILKAGDRIEWVYTCALGNDV